MVARWGIGVLLWRVLARRACSVVVVLALGLGALSAGEAMAGMGPAGWATPPCAADMHGEHAAHEAAAESVPHGHTPSSPGEAGGDPAGGAACHDAICCPVVCTGFAALPSITAPSKARYVPGVQQLLLALRAERHDRPPRIS